MFFNVKQTETEQMCDNFSISAKPFINFMSHRYDLSGEMKRNTSKSQWSDERKNRGYFASIHSKNKFTNILSPGDDDEFYIFSIHHRSFTWWNFNTFGIIFKLWEENFINVKDHSGGQKNACHVAGCICLSSSLN